MKHPIPEDSGWQELLSPTATLTQVMKALDVFETGALAAPSVRLGLSSTVTISLLGTYLRKHAALNGVRLEVTQGNYDDLMGDVERYVAEGIEQVVVVPFLDNVLPSFEAQLGSLSSADLQAKESELRARYRLALGRGKSLAAIYLGTFHRMSSPASPSGEDEIDLLVARLNRMLREEAAVAPNVRIIDAEAVLRAVGAQAAFDERFYFRAKAPYSARYLDAFASVIATASRGFGQYYFKVLVVDGDNTLWGGVVGEDLVSGIKLSAYDYPGNIFWRIQHEIARLESQGVLVCLCSKNNPADVDELFATSNMPLKAPQIVLRKVNWADKVSNLREIADELNLGLDSIVFLDDSEFECNAVRSQLPQVRVFQVPANLSEYPRVMREIASLFIGGGVAAESKSKTQQYRHLAAAEELKAQFGSQADYLRSLSLRVILARNSAAVLQRISELSRKSNQFNLTTHRYSEGELAELMSGASSDVYSLSVSDRFGDAGLTGVAVMRYDGTVAQIEAFFMSCRVIGRGVEFAIWPTILDEAARRGCTEVRAEFVPSAKNALAAEFYDELGLERIAAEGSAVHYRLPLPAAGLATRDWIELNHG